MANVGTMNIVISADIAEMASSLLSGVKSIEHFGNRVTKMNEELLQESRILQMGATEAMRYQMALAGIPEETRKQTIALMEQVQTMKDHQRAAAEALAAEATFRREQEVMIQRVAQQEEAYRRRITQAKYDSLFGTDDAWEAVKANEALRVAEANRASQRMRQQAMYDKMFNAVDGGESASMSGGMFGRLDEIKKTFGARGPLKDLFELAVGGGAFAGLTFGANMLKDWSENAKRWSEELAVGKKTVEEITAELLKSVPIAGQIGATVDNLVMIFNGSAKEIALMNEEAKILDGLFVGFKKTVDDSAESLRELIKQLDSARGGNVAMASLSGLTPQEKEIAEIRQKYQQEEQKRLADAEGALKRIEQEANAAILEARRKLMQLPQVAKPAVPRGEEIVQPGVVDGLYYARQKQWEAYQAYADAVAKTDLQIKQQLKLVEDAKAEHNQKLDQIDAQRREAMQREIDAKIQEQKSKAQAERPMLLPMANVVDNSFNLAEQFKKDADEIQRFAEGVRKSLETPQQKFDAFLQSVNASLAAQRLTVDEAAMAIENYKKQMDAVSRPDLRFAGFESAGGATGALAEQISVEVGRNIKDEQDSKTLTQIRDELSKLNAKLNVGESVAQ